MTRDKARELIPVLQAFADGKTVQVGYVDGATEWVDYTGHSPGFENENWKWRVKPEPREGYVPAYTICFSKESAMILAKAHMGSILGQQAEIIHVREVIE